MQVLATAALAATLVAPALAQPPANADAGADARESLVAPSWDRPRPPVRYHVAPNGRDSWSGSLTWPNWQNRADIDFLMMQVWTMACLEPREIDAASRSVTDEAGARREFTGLKCSAEMKALS